MLEKKPLKQPDSSEICRDLNKTEDLKIALAETRLSLIHRLTELEVEIERRFLDTFNHVNLQVTQTTEMVSNKIIKPINQLEKRMNYLPQKLKKSPYQSLAAAIGCGLFMGAWLGARTRQQQNYLPNSPDHQQLKFQKTNRSTISPMREIATSIALSLAQQLIKSGLDNLSQRHAKSTAKSRIFTNLDS